MKKLLYILAAAAVVFSCAKEEIQHPSEKNVPEAASYQPVITVNQETNEVTFSLDATAVIPVWVFQNSDGAWADTHTGNGYKRIFASAGDYSVRMQVMNASGVSPDYVEKSFHIDNTIVNFDKYITILSKGPWHIDGFTEAHMACGESVENPTGWWSAPKNDKAAFGVYDNKLSFSTDGKYTFDPGEPGTVYVNIGVTVSPFADAKGDATADFQAPAQQQTTGYGFDVEGESLYLSLDPGSLFPYIPNDDFVSDTRFLITEFAAKSITLVWYTPTGNNGGPIAWQFILTNVEGGSEPIDNPGGEGGYTYGDNLLGGLYFKEHWFSPANWAGGLDPQLTFEGGKVTLTVPAEVGGLEWQGQVKLVADVPADPEKKYAFFATIESSTDGTATVKLADANDDSNHAFFHDNNVGLTAFDALSYKKEPVSPDQAYDAVMVIFDFGRMAAGTEITITNIELREITGEIPGGGGQSGYTYGDELLGGLYFKEHWFSPANWAGGLDPNLVFENGEVTLTGPAEVGGIEWQGQVKLVADIPADPEKKYSFACKIESSSDGTATIKVADANDDSNHAFFYDNAVQLAAYEEVSYKNEPVSPDQAYDAVMVIFDFGRMAPGTVITISGMSLREITGETSGGGSQGGGDSASDYGASLIDGLYFKEHWFSPANWAGGLDPNLKFEGGKVTLTVPEGVGGIEWQGQVKLVADVPASPSTEYRFACKIESSSDGTATIKVADANDDSNHAFFYDNNVALEAYDVISYSKAPVSPDQEYSAIMVIFDFGRIAAGTEITITDITLSAKK